MDARSEPLQELGSLAEKIARDGIAAVVIDAADRQNSGGEMKRIAARMRASHIPISDLSAASVLEAVQDCRGTS
jgi:Mg-chelatase subunit ChlD